MHKCWKCDTEYEGNFCPECGAKWEEEKKCPNCGKTLAGGVKFCSDCGYSFVSAPPASPKSVPTASPVTEGTKKLYAFVSIFPAALFALLSVVLMLLFLAPVAVMPGGELLGQTIPSESYGNVYEISNFDGSSLTGSLTTLIIFAACALFLTAVIILTALFIKARYKRVTIFGKRIFLRNVFAGIGYALFFLLFLIACILLGQISNEDGGFGIFTAGAAPILILVFTLIGCLVALGCVIAGALLRKAYPALVAETENRVAAAKPTKAETWIKQHKALMIILAVLLIIALVVGIAVPIGLANRHNGTYYVYDGEMEEYNMEKFYKLSGGTWENENGEKGKISFDGEKVTLTYDSAKDEDIFGNLAEELEEAEGTIRGDVLMVRGIIYAKEGHRHEFESGLCACGAKYASLGLSYEDIDEYTVAVKGRGSCKSREIVIPKYYNKKLVTSICDEAFNEMYASAMDNYGETCLVSITIPDSVTEIGEDAFGYCHGLKSVTFEGESNLKTVGHCAFYYCSSLTGVYIENLEAWCKIYFSTGMFGEMSNPLYYAQHLYLAGKEITHLIIPDEVTEIGAGVFERAALTSVTIHSGVKSIGYEAFFECDLLETVYFCGTPDEWQAININVGSNGMANGNAKLVDATRYYYSDLAPTEEQWAQSKNWWHYGKENEIVIWNEN